MKCQECGRTMQPVYGQDHFHCPTCHSFNFPTDLESSTDGIQPTEKMTEFRCAKCPDQPLEVGLIGKLQVCFCNQCRGFVIDSGSLGILLNSRRAQYRGPDDTPTPLDQIALAETINCPACYEPMESHPYYGPGTVVLNSCDGCKLVWLDHGEMASIVRAPGLRR